MNFERGRECLIYSINYHYFLRNLQIFHNSNVVVFMVPLLSYGLSFIDITSSLDIENGYYYERVHCRWF